MVNADEFDRFADNVKPWPILDLFGFGAIMPLTQMEDWLERLTAPADGVQSKGESNGKV
jgi:hypothetical protein